MDRSDHENPLALMPCNISAQPGRSTSQSRQDVIVIHLRLAVAGLARSRQLRCVPPAKSRVALPATPPVPLEQADLTEPAKINGGKPAMTAQATPKGAWKITFL